MSNEVRNDDAAFAERFVKQHNGVLKYIPEDNLWAGWDGNRWSYGADNRYERAIQTADSIFDEIKGHANNDDQKRLFDMGKRYRNTGHINQALKQAQEKMRHSKKEFDSDPEVINCNSGVLNLRTGTLALPSSSNLVMKKANVRYNPKAECPLWLKYLDEIFEKDADLIKFMQITLGYALTGLTREQLAFFLYGRGRNGKGTLCETIMAIMGDYARTFNIKAFLDGGLTNVRVQAEIADLQGVRFAKGSEINRNESLNAALFKLFTGGDTRKGAQLYGRSYEYRPTDKPFFLTNYLPTINDGTVAMQDRIVVIPFNVTYDEETKDRDLSDKFIKEYEGIFAWLVEGAKMYLEKGRLPELPKVVKEATDNYHAEQDSLRRFIRDKMVREKGAECGVQETYDVYTAWCSANGVHIPKARNHFRKDMDERGIKAKENKKAPPYGYRFLNYRLSSETERKEEAVTNTPAPLFMH
jgi:putative DNA primase/helicase